MATDTGLATAGNTLIGIHNTLSGTTADSVTVAAASSTPAPALLTVA